MAQPGRTMIGCKSSVSFGIHSESKKLLEMRKIRFQNRRFSVLVAAAIFSLFLVLISLLVFDIMNSSKASKNAKAKRFIHLEEVENLDKIQPLHQKSFHNEVAQDVFLMPEKPDQITTKRMDEHPNHRYSEIEPEEKIIDRMMKNIYNENGWSPQPFKSSTDVNVKTVSTTSFNNIQDIIRHVEDTEKQKLAPAKINPIPEYIGLSKPIRFRGVYVKPKEPDNEENKDEKKENESYLQQINELFDVNPTEVTSVGEGFQKNHKSDFKENSGTDSLLQAIPYSRGREQPPPRQFKKMWTKEIQENQEIKKPKKKPITVMLDIYPMTKTEEPEMPTTEKPRKEMIYIPIKPGEEFFEPFATVPTRNVPFKLMPPNQRRIVPVAGPKGGRMIMKLNLYPKSREMKKRGGLYNPQTDTRIGEVIYPQNQVADRRTFGFFSKLKKKFHHHHDDCNIIGHNPHGKPITAKWKDDNGDWVHAKYVALKEWDDYDDWKWGKWGKWGNWGWDRKDETLNSFET